MKIAETIMRVFISFSASSTCGLCAGAEVCLPSSTAAV